MIDWKRVGELRSEIGQDGFAEVVEIFLEEVEMTLRRLSADSAAGLEADLHFLKGSAWNLGFVDLGALCHAGERMAAAGRAAEVDLGQIAARYVSTRQIFLAGLAADGAGPAQVA